MYRILLSICCYAIINVATYAQSCPGCEIAVPDDLPQDTVFLSEAARGQVGMAYDSDISFRLPLTTTPVANEDTPGGLTINEFEITGIANLPPGLEWTPSQTTFNPAEMNDGCAKICGTPLVAGEFIVQVSLVATVLVINAETVLDVPITIAPRQSTTEGFTLRNGTGCGSTLVAFRNNVPSNGDERFSYQWDFGNGQMTDRENPLDVEYDAAGEYIVDYQAIVDTTGYFLTDVLVNSVECDDFLGRPDLQVKIFDSLGVEVFASAIIENAEPPLNISTNFKIVNESYTLSVLDIDGGVAGENDLCGEFILNQLPTGDYPGVTEVVSINYSILNPIDTIRSQDTVVVYPLPAEPQVTVEGELAFCAGDSTTLRASYNENVQWYLDSTVLINETNAVLTLDSPGGYSVAYTSPDGCTVVSDTIDVIVNDNPTPVEFSVDDNLLIADDTSSLAEGTSLQWYVMQQGIPGANEGVFCINMSGVYGLEFTNTAGCTTRFEREVIYDENFPNCVSDVVAIEELGLNFKLYPNPATELLNIELDLPQRADVQLTVFDALGQMISDIIVEDVSGTFNRSLPIVDLQTGFYFLKIRVGAEESMVKFIKQ